MKSFRLLRFDISFALIGLVVLGAILLLRLSAFGIWDPWELNFADQARDLASGKSSDLQRPSIPSWLVALGFKAFGFHEWSGRLPIALMGLITCVLAYALVARFEGARTGAYAAIITGTSPLLLLNARQMLGDAPAFAAQTFVALAASAAVLGATSETTDAKTREGSRATYIWLAALVVAITFAMFTRGALLGALPPLLAVVVASYLSGQFVRPSLRAPRSIATWAVCAITVALTAIVLGSVLADHADYDSWRGGYPHGGNPPTFGTALEDVFHSFAPWSGLLVLAFGILLVAPEMEKRAADEGSEGPYRPAPDELHAIHGPYAFRWMLGLWAAFGYGALALYTSRYGSATYLAVVAIAGAVAVFLGHVETSRKPWWTTAIVAVLFVGLLLRDYRLYPGAAVSGLPISDITIPDVFNPKREWAALLGAFALVALFSLIGAPNDERRIDLKAPYRLLKAQWKRDRASRAWLVFLATVATGAIVFGVLSLVARDALRLTTLASKVGVRGMIAFLALPVLVAGAQLLAFVFGKLGRARFIPLLVVGAASGAYAAQGYLPSLSAHFSPREVYDTYNALARSGEPLGEYRVGSRAATYYARGETREIASQNELIQFLKTSQRRWAVLPADELAAVDRSFRRETGQHVFVADARSASVVLATNRPVPGRKNANFVAEYVLDRVPNVEHRVGAKYEDKIELVGYDLDTPHEGYVGAGESFTVTWYWRVLSPIPGSYQVFLHVDGRGDRLNGDHEPVDGKYPVRLWDEGDVVVDRQELTVPANYGPGAYTFWIGFFSGSKRLEVVEGPEDEADRVRAGVLRVQ